MFQWLVRRISKGILRQFELDLKPMILKTMQDTEFQDHVVSFTDELWERYKIKALQTLNGYTRSANITGAGILEDGIPNILNKKGQVDMKSLIPFALQYFMKGHSQSQSSNRLP
jgi:hypothetical protein